MSDNEIIVSKAEFDDLLAAKKIVVSKADLVDLLAEKDSLRYEVERLRLTAAEREAVQAAIDSCDSGADFNDQRIWPALAKRLRARSVTLRGLLERTEGAE